MLGLPEREHDSQFSFLGGNMEKVREGNYIVVQSFMVSELKLKGNELLVYAIIYGFTQAENQRFTGSLQYLAEWTNSTKQGVLKNLKSLVEKGYIGRETKNINGVTFVEYYSTEFNRGVKQSLTGGIKQSLTNNINTNNKDNNKDIYITKAVEEWNTISSLPKVVLLSDKRKKALKLLFNDYSWEQYEKVIENIKESTFLNGTGGKWACSFDWVLNKGNFLKILEGNYQDKNREKPTDRWRTSQNEKEWGEGGFVDGNSLRG